MPIFSRSTFLDRSIIDALQLFAKRITCFFSYLLCFLSFPLRKWGIRVFACGTNIGHFSEEPATYLREQQLGRIPSSRTILFPPHFKSIFSRRPIQRNFCNSYLVDLWKQRFWVISNPYLAFLLQPILRAPWLIQFPEYCSDKKGKSTHAIHWEYFQKFPYTPMLKLPEDDIKKGKKILKSWGLKENSWFICFHAREPGYYDDEDVIRNGIRNCDIATYQEALLEVLRRGGWCIRLGSSKTAKLPSCLQGLERVIDYPHTEHVSDFMDIFLLSSCRFLLGSQSGLINVPGLFCIPSVLINIIPMNNMPLYPLDIGIFKRYRCQITNKIIPFHEAFRSMLAFSTTPQDYTDLRVEVVDNTADEIKDAVEEMLDRLDGTFQEDEEGQTLQQAFRFLIPPTIRSQKAVSRVGSKYLKKHKSLLT